MVVCPGESELRSLLEGRIDAARIGVLDGHLKDCEACRSLLDRLTDVSSALMETVEDAAELLATRPAALPEVPGFAVVRMMGRGGHGVVYQAVNLALGRTVALKMLHSPFTATAGERSRLHVNAEAMARLSHPNVVALYSVGETAGQLYLEMEAVDGGSLAEFPSDSLPDERETARLLCDLAAGLGAAHEHGILHRDLKPANVLLQTRRSAGSRRSLSSYVPKIADFGLAKLDRAATVATPSAAIVGTPAYMAPEMAFGRVNQASPATDIYGLGAIGYELLTGRPPLQGATPFDTLLMVRQEEPTPLRKLRHEVSKDLETIILKCLDKEPNRRYPSASALAEDLDRFLKGRPVQARPIGPARRAWRLARRNPVIAGLLTLITVLMIGSIVGLSLLYRRSVLNAELSQKRQQTVRQALKASAKSREHQFWFPQQVSPDDLDAILSLYALHEESLADFRDDPETVHDCLYAMLQLTDMIRQIGQPDQLLPRSERTRERLRALADQHPARPLFKHSYAEATIQLADACSMMGNSDRSRELIREAFERARDLHRSHPANNHYATTYACFASALANELVKEERWEEARELWNESLQMQRKLIERYPEDTNRYGFYARASSYALEAAAYRGAGPKELLPRFNELIEQLHKTRQIAPARVAQYSWLPNAYCKAAVCHYRLGQFDDAAACLDRGVQITRQIALENPGVNECQWNLLNIVRENLCRRLLTRDAPGASAQAVELHKLTRELRSRHPEHVTFWSHEFMILLGSSDAKPSTNDIARLTADCEAFLKRSPENSTLLLHLAEVQLAGGNPERALMTLGSKPVEKLPKVDHQRLFAGLIRARALAAVGRRDEALNQLEAVERAAQADCLVSFNLLHCLQQTGNLLKSNRRDAEVP